MNKKSIITNKVLSFVFAMTTIVSLFLVIGASAAIDILKINGVTIDSKSSSVTGNITDVSSDEIENSFTFHNVGDYVIYKITIQNNKSDDVIINTISDNNSNSYVEYEYDKHENETISGNGTLEFKVKATYKNELTDITKRDQAFSVKFLFDLTYNGQDEDSSIIINPVTGDRLLISILLLVFSSLGLIASLIINRREKTAKMLVIIGLLLTPFIIKAASYEYDIDLISNYGLYDKEVVTITIGDETSTSIVPYKSFISEPTAPSKIGYNFKRWETQNGEPFDFETPIVDDTNIKAVYEAIEYDITYNLNGGSANNTTKYTIEDTVTLTAPTKNGYNFAGWTGTDLTEPTKNVTFSSKTGSRSYTATYTPIEYEIKYYRLTEEELNALPNPTSYTIEDSDITLTNPSNRVDNDGDVTEVFTGWTYGDSTSITVTIPSGSTGKKEFTANFVPKELDTYTITYDLVNGTVSEPNPTTYTVKTPTFTLHNPYKPGYEFDGWTGTGLTGVTKTVTIANRSTGNREYTANYSKISYSIQYSGISQADAIASGNLESYDVETNTFTLVNPTKEGYTFAGWTGTGLTGLTQTVTITKGSTGDRNYTANFSLVDYDIDYTLNGGSITGTNPTTYNVETGVIVLINPTKEGYTFKGWSGTDLTGDENTSVTIPSGATGDREYTANFTANKYDVIFEKNGTGVTGTMADQELTYDVQDNLTTNSYERTGYIFNGWNTDPDGLGTSYSNGAEVLNLVTSGSITLYAQWIDDMVTLSFDENGGNTVTDISVRRGESTSLPTPTNDDTTKVFLGWYEDLTDTNPVSDPYTVSSDTELIAKWSSIICKKATTLHSDTCNSTTTNQGCRAAGMTNGQEFTYGNINKSDTFATGDAFDCDVDGSGYNVRFYYLYTNNDNAVLIAYNNYETVNNVRQFGSTQNYKYAAKDEHIPNATEWTNLPVTFGEKAARIIEMSEIKGFTGLTETELEASGSLDNYKFLFENTSYNGSSLRSTYWINEWEQDGVTTRGRIHKNDRYVHKLKDSEMNSSNNSVRPVIEVPTILIDDSYIVEFNPGNGTINTKYVSVKKGTSLGSVPTPTYTGYTFNGWYSDEGLSTPIDENHIPTGYETYYAGYKKNIDVSTLEYDEFDLTINDTDTITFYDESEVEPRTYASNDSSIASVDENGNITANAVGTTSIVITGSLSGTTKVVTVIVQEEAVTCTVFFDEDGGVQVTDMVIPRNATIGSVGNIPGTTKTNYVFDGWFTDNTFAHEVTNDTVVKTDITVIAKWVPSDAVAEVNIGNYYTDLSSAITAASNNDTIKILKDFTLSASVDVKKDLTIDLNNKTITSSGRALQIYSKVEIVGPGTITTNGGSGAVDVVKNDTMTGELTMNSGRIINTRTASTRKQALYVNGGIAHIGGTAYLESRADGNANPSRATVQCLGGGTIYITGGTIVNDHNSTYSYAVANSSGTVIIGTEDGAYDKTTPVIRGNQYGLKSNNNATFEIYDGIIMGKNAAMDSEANISNYETGATKVNDTDGDYKTLYYQMPAGKIRITLNTDGGNLPSGANDYVLINLGSQVGTLPEPTKGIYTFDGWFDDNDQEVLSTRVPIQDEIYHAVWSYTPSDTPVSFNMTNDVMMNYFNNINTWKTQYTVTGTKVDVSDYTEVLDSTEFEASMRANFDAYNCSYCSTDPNNNKCDNPSAGNRCELSKGYDTGLGEDVNVYEYNTLTQEKTLVTYTTSDDGIIYNMIPGKTYRWESTSDSNIYGYVAPTAVRRTIYSSARNVRDLGGMSVSFTRDNATKTGTLKYGKLYRGAQLSKGQTDVDSLTKLGITREVDLRIQTEGNNPVRLPKHDKCDGNCGTLPSGQDIIMTNYLIYPSNSANYSSLRDTLKYVMTSVVNGDSIYFHCTIGSDRTGTLAYFLEGLLGVSEEERLEDYELSYFYGMLNRTRFHDNLSSSSINPRFTSMYKTYDTNDKIYDWYMYGLTNEQKASEKVLIEQFRDAMIDYN